MPGGVGAFLADPGRLPRGAAAWRRSRPDPRAGRGAGPRGDRRATRCGWSRSAREGAARPRHCWRPRPPAPPLTGGRCAGAGARCRRRHSRRPMPPRRRWPGRGRGWWCWRRRSCGPVRRCYKAVEASRRRRGDRLLPGARGGARRAPSAASCRSWACRPSRAPSNGWPQRLGEDRMLLRRELEKLALFVGAGRQGDAGGGAWPAWRKARRSTWRRR